MIQEDDYPKPWPLWQKVLFRFFFIYLLLHVASGSFFQGIPLLGLIDRLQVYLIDISVNAFNDYILHFQDELVPLNGSGDTSFGWVQLIFYFCLAVLGTVIWSIADRKRKSYYRAAFYLYTALRYFVAYVSFTYGVIKLFALQMPFPSLSALATPMGDFLPMRFSWYFIGYSTVYQVFSGIMEITVGVLLLYRRTVTLGLVIGLGVYINVMMINLSYDVPVKIFSAHMVLMCLFLVMADIKRLANFFIFNRPATHNTMYHFVPSKKSRKIFRLVFKLIFLGQVIFLIVGVVGMSANQLSDDKQELKPIPYGIYEVNTFVKNGDTLPVLANDSLIWKDMIFESPEYVSVNTTDTLLRKSYRRGSFYFKNDSIKNTMVCYKFSKGDSIHLFDMKYHLKDKEHVQLWTKIKADSLYFELNKSDRKFQLAERQFHWISEYNR